MPVSLRLVTLNIERSNHLHLVLPFLRQANADVVCLQEVCEKDMPALEALLGKSFFAPMVDYGEGVGMQGVAVFTKLPFTARAARYAGTAGPVGKMDKTSRESMYETTQFVLAAAQVQKGSSIFSLLTTHLPATAKGEVTSYQAQAFEGLFAELQKHHEFVLCGDFNAPRGGAMFASLAAKYTDNVPPQHKTSLDIALHRAGKSNAAELADKMVDGIFSTPSYSVSDVEMISGVSDHQALVATLTKL